MSMFAGTPYVPGPPDKVRLFSIVLYPCVAPRRLDLWSIYLDQVRLTPSFLDRKL